MKRIHWPAILAAAVTIAGALTSPEVLAVLPAKAAGVITLIGVVLQAATKPVNRR